jgi:hypothetical protein
MMAILDECFKLLERDLPSAPGVRVVTEQNS